MFGWFQILVLCGVSVGLLTNNDSRGRPTTHATEQRNHLKHQSCNKVYAIEYMSVEWSVKLNRRLKLSGQSLSRDNLSRQGTRDWAVDLRWGGSRSCVCVLFSWTCCWLWKLHDLDVDGQSSGAAWKSKWPSWAFHPNEHYGFCGRKAALNHASALVTVCP